jgi:hypothetical protein
MKRIIAALALAVFATPAVAQSPSVMNYSVERIDKHDVQGLGLGTALLKITNHKNHAVFVTARCSFVDGDLRPLAAGSSVIPLMPKRSHEYVTIRAEMTPAALDRFHTVRCSAHGSRY